MDLPEALQYARPGDPFHMEYNRRKGHFVMSRFHIHRCYEIYYLFAGERGFFLKDQVYPVQAGDLIVIDSDEVHKTLDIGVPDHERIVFYYELPFFDRYDSHEASFLLSSFRKSQVLRLPLKQRMQIEGIFHSFLQELTEASPGYELQLRQLAAELLLRSARLAAAQSEPLAGELAPAQLKVKEIVQFINGHYGEALRMDTIAHQFFISPGYLSRTFRENTGFTVTEYINIVRVKEAQKLLCSTALSITEISERVGFDNFSHFGKMFKKLSRLSPREFRRQYGVRT